MSSNRSIYKFTTLSMEEIDKGLRIAFHNREKMYSELKIEVDKKGISAYDRENAISRKKLQKICAYTIYKFISAQTEQSLIYS